MVRPDGWSAEQCAPIIAALEETPGRKVATFDFDNTCIQGDVGELFATYLAQNRKYRTDLDAFWELIHPEDGRDELRALAKNVGSHTDGQLKFLGEMSALYLRKLKRDGKEEAYAWAVRLHVGLTEDEMADFSKSCINDELSRPFGTRRFPLFDGHVEVSQGMRPRLEIVNMMRWLESRDCEVWIVSATNAWTVKVAGQLFGIPTVRCLGTRVVVDDGILTNEIDPPSFYREGKRTAILRDIGVQPVVAFGDSDTDIEMLQLATSAIVVSRSNRELVALAEENGWPIRDEDSFTW